MFLGPPEDARGPHEEHHSGDEIENRQLDFGEQRDAGLTHDPDDQRAGERAFQAPQAANHHNNEREHERVDAMPSTADWLGTTIAPPKPAMKQPSVNACT